MALRNLPGVGFYPSDEKLLGYLKKKILGEDIPEGTLPVVDLYGFKPSDIPTHIERSLIENPRQSEWYFLCPRYNTNRTVPEVGYWQITGRPKNIVSRDTGEVLGKKSILTFKRSTGSSENGHWAVHEYTLDSSYLGYNIDQMPFVAYCLKRK